MELPADLADEFDETSLHRTMDILVTVPELELVRLRLGEDAPQPVGEGRDILAGEDPRLTEHGDVGDGPGDIIDQKTAVGVIDRVPPEHLGGGLPKTSAPERHHSPSPRRSSARRRSRNALRRMKPAASAWS